MKTFHIGDRVRVKSKKWYLKSRTGVIDSIDSLTTKTKTTFEYCVRLDRLDLTYNFSAGELELLVTPEKVQFS